MDNKTEPNHKPNTPTTPPNPVADAVTPIDKICYESEDQQIVISQLVKGAKKFPPSNYPCVVLAVKPVEHTRVRRIAGEYVEIMPSFREMEELVDAMNHAALASGKGKLYDILQRVPEKPHARKQHWKQRNEIRVQKQLKSGSWQGKKSWHKN